MSALPIIRDGTEIPPLTEKNQSAYNKVLWRAAREGSRLLQCLSSVGVALRTNPIQATHIRLLRRLSQVIMGARADLNLTLESKLRLQHRRSDFE